MAYDPRGLSIERWSALTAALLLPYGYVPTSTTEANWRSWAAAVRNIPEMGARYVPSAKGYQHWQDWGQRVNQALRGLGL